jgi:hypothetical protein
MGSGTPARATAGESEDVGESSLKWLCSSEARDRRPDNNHLYSARIDRLPTLAEIYALPHIRRFSRTETLG